MYRFIESLEAFVCANTTDLVAFAKCVSGMFSLKHNNNSRRKNPPGGVVTNVPFAKRIRTRVSV